MNLSLFKVDWQLHGILYGKLAVVLQYPGPPGVSEKWIPIFEAQSIEL